MLNSCLLLIILIYCTNVEGVMRPYLLSHRRIVVEGSSKTGSVKLDGVARNGNLKWILVTQPDNSTITNLTLSSTGRLQLYGICKSCQINTQFKLTLKDDSNSRSYILKVESGDRALKSQLVLQQEEPTKRRGLSLIYIYLIIEGACIAVMLVTCLLVMNCCTFHTAVYDRPIRNWNKVKAAVLKPQRNHEMNPYAKQKRLSLLVREAVRSGAADGTPYYGTRKSGVWIPENEQGPSRVSSGTYSPKQPKRETVEPRAKVNREDTTPVQQSAERRASKPRRPSLATVGRKLSQDMSLFKQVPWNDISQPQTTTILPPPEE